MTYTQQPQQTERRLTRRSGDRIFAGVASGIADHIDINVWFVRLAFFVLAFAGGFGVLAYITAWLVIPREDEDDPIVTQWIERFDVSDAGTLFGVLLVAVAGIIVVAQIADVSTVLVIAAVLFVVGYLLFKGDLGTKSASGPSTPSPESSDESFDGDETAEDVAPDAAMQIVAVEGDANEQVAKPRRQPRPKREPSILGRITIAAGLIVLATMALVDVAFARVEILPVHYVATAAGVLGLGLVVGAWVGRARWLAVVGVLLLPILWFAALAPAAWTKGAGERTFAPTSVSEVRAEYGLGAGQLTLDLTALTPSELAEIELVSVSMGAGEVIVYLPSDAGVSLGLEVGAGEISGPFRTESGLGVDVNEEVGPRPYDLRLEVEVGLGVISIQTTDVREVTG